VRGRLIDDGDGRDAPQVAVISRMLARTKWPDQDPIGRYVQFGNMDGDLRGMRIVGVVGDVRELSPESRAQPMLYGVARQRPVKASSFSLIARGPEPDSISGSVRAIVRELNPEAPVRIRTVETALDEVLGSRRFHLWLIGAFSSVAFEKRARFQILEGGASDEVFQSLRAGAVAVSENFARHFDVHPGQRIPLSVKDGTREFTVSAVVVDYTVFTSRAIWTMERGEPVSASKVSQRPSMPRASAHDAGHTCRSAKTASRVAAALRQAGP